MKLLKNYFIPKQHPYYCSTSHSKAVLPKHVKNVHGNQFCKNEKHKIFFCYTVLLNFVCNLYCMCNTSDEKKMTALHYTSIYSFGETNVFTPRKTPSKLDESRDYSGGKNRN